MKKDLEVISIFGGRGSGKTTKAKELIFQPSRKRVIVYDLKAEYPYKKLKGMRDFAAYMKKNWRNNFIVSYVPEAREKPEHIEELSTLCYAVANAQECDAKMNKGKNLTLLVEEMSVTAPNQKYPTGQGGFEYSVNIAREWGVEVIGISQRPAQVNPDFRGNSSLTFYYALTDDLDVKAAKQKLGNEADQLKTLQPHDYIKFHRGAVTRGRNKLK